jgi:hypothetical protein
MFTVTTAFAGAELAEEEERDCASACLSTGIRQLKAQGAACRTEFSTHRLVNRLIPR